MNLSSATIRNVMADLEGLGFVSSPHTSAGRIPTDKGYRLLRRLAAEGASRLDDDPAFAELRRQLEDVARRPQGAGRRRVAGAVERHAAGGRRDTAARSSRPSLSQIEFVPLSDNRVLAILVVNGREVQNRILQLERYYSPTSCGAPRIF